MAGITGLSTTFGLPNYHGELFALTPATTPFLSAIGGLTGGKRATGATQTEWQAFDLRNAAAGRTRLEGADAPTAEERVRMNLSNVLEIHQEAVTVSYTKQAATQTYSGINVGSTDNPVTDENTWQINQALATIGLDTEASFLYGQYNLPTDNTTARTTRGLRPAIIAGINGKSNVLVAGTDSFTGATVVSSSGVFTVTHDFSVGDELTLEGGDAVGINSGQTYYIIGVTGTASFTISDTKGGTIVKPSANYTTGAIHKAVAVTSAMIGQLMQQVWQNGGLTNNETATIIVGGAQKRALSTALITNANYRETSRNVGGVNVTTIETDFGMLNIMLDRQLRSGDLIICSLDQCAPVMLEIPGKGFLFVEPLAQTGASFKNQMYGEIGLEYGSPIGHGLLTGLSV